MKRAPGLIAALAVVVLAGTATVAIFRDGTDPAPPAATDSPSVSAAISATGSATTSAPTLDSDSATSAPVTTSAPAQQRAATPTVSVPAGSYEIGATGADDERPPHRVSVPAFRIDRFEVTNAQYVRYLNQLGVAPIDDGQPGAVSREAFSAEDRSLFLEGGDGEQRAGLLIALDDEHARIGVQRGRFVADPVFSSHPVTETTWDGAHRYARWADGRLPTEVEWEAAARGRDGRTYPWGEQAPTERLAIFGRGSGETAAVGSAPMGATPEGVEDMAGNVDEWTSTLYRPYPYRSEDGREGSDPTAGERVTRGGNHVYSSAHELRSAYRTGFSRAEDRGHRHIGFRVVYDD